MGLYTDLPIELGQEYRFKTISNFKWILNKVDSIDKVIEKHKTEDRKAHNATQVVYKKTNVYNELNHLREQVIALVLGANGDGVQELRDSRVSLDGTRFPLLSDRLKYELGTLENKIDDEVEYITNYYS